MCLSEQSEPFRYEEMERTSPKQLPGSGANPLIGALRGRRLSRDVEPSQVYHPNRECPGCPTREEGLSRQPVPGATALSDRNDRGFRTTA